MGASNMEEIITAKKCHKINFNCIANIWILIPEKCTDRYTFTFIFISNSIFQLILSYQGQNNDFSLKVAKK